MYQLSPIVVFAYNRPHHLEQTLVALMENDLASESNLYIYCDGPKKSATAEQLTEIVKVRQVTRQRQWCKQVHIIESDQNKGLADSIIEGVTEIVNKYGRIIVLEDDIVTSTGFLKYMNDVLTFYQGNEKVMHVSAYMYPHKGTLPETFFFNVPYPGGGWATWQRAWVNFNDDAFFFYNYFDKQNQWSKFNKVGGKYLQKQLRANVDGELKTWFIKWHATLIMLNGFTLYPCQSLTNNIGFDETATNCSPMTKFDIEQLADQISVETIPFAESNKATRIIVRFYQGRFYLVRSFVIKITPEWIKPLFKIILKLK